MASDVKLSILLLEDHYDTSRVLCSYLTSRGHSVELVVTVRAAREAISRQNFDVFLSDVGLPDGQAWSLSDLIRSNPQMYSVALSGFGMDDDVSRSVAAGYRLHLTKPNIAAGLERCLREAGDQRRSATNSAEGSQRATPC